ncbi:HAD hydrolase-like protein [uncultured Streptococcus sp.]|uniref:HAD hydrolase-like protein n=1 Tax=uncultured Streptococcus sp. TaxID=83427 RepID=UPI0028DC389F|nr:HAD hydrolase-like protein [uncultured Streptococcus sp.]
MIFTYIFFDLDGTLIDSSEGIHNGFVQTFERLGLPVPSDQKIQSFMGPPLEVTFKEEISEEGATQAVKIYRDYYETKGQFEAHLYDGIKEVLEKLSQEPNKKIYITTSKNEPTALKMCEYLGITEFFDGIYGATPTAFHKSDVLQRAITENNANKDSSVIVGDTKYDMIGGNAVGIKTLAVTWGFGTNETLLAENPDFVADTAQELWDILK